MAGRTCNNNTLPGSFDRGPNFHSSFFAMPNFPESFVGMTECCKPNKLHVTGEDEFEECVLWCVIPDAILKPDGKNLGGDEEVLGGMKDCVQDRGGFGDDGAYVVSWAVRENGAPARGVGWMGMGMGVWGFGGCWFDERQVSALVWYVMDMLSHLQSMCCSAV